MLSEDVKLYMKLLTSKRYYALNDRAINLLMKGKSDMSAAVGDEVVGVRQGDEEITAIIEEEQEVEIVITEKDKTRAGGAFFAYLNNTIFDLDKYGVFKTVGRNNYKHNCLYLALQAGGLSDIKLQELILTLRNGSIHKCDLENVCHVLETHIELTSIKNDGLSRIEYYGSDFYEKCNVGLAKGHYFINDYTELTSYCL